MTSTPLAPAPSSKLTDDHVDILRSSGNVAKILSNRMRGDEHSPPTRDGHVNQSSESAISSNSKDFLNKHQSNISRLAQFFGNNGGA